MLQGRWRVLFAVAAAQAAVTMGLLSLNVILPRLTASFKVDVSTGSWMVNATLVCLVATLLPAGRLGDRYGHARLFVYGILGYAASAVLAGLSPNLWTFLVFRGLQGVAAAFVMSPSFALLSQAFPANQQGRAFAALTIAGSAGSSLGNITGALMTQYLTWRGLFWFVGPIALGAWWLARGIEARQEQRVAQPVDWPGAILLFTTLVAFSLGLNHFHDGPETFAGGWRWHLPMHAVTAVLLALFLWVEHRSPHPFVPLRHFANVPFSAGITTNGILHGTMMAGFFILPFLVDKGMGLTPTHAAAATIFLSIVSVACAPFSGWLYDRGGGRWLLPISMGVVGLMMVWIGMTGGTMTYAALCASLAVLGIGTGMFWTANNAAVMATLPRDLRGLASGMLSTTTQLGHSIGATVSGALLTEGVAAATLTGDKAILYAQFRLAWLAFAAIAFLAVCLSFLERPHEDAKTVVTATAD